jgi:hypothetical protein
VARTSKPSYLFIVIGAGIQLIAWLLIRPDRAGATWTDGIACEVWVGVEAALAVAIGLSSPDRRTAGWTVLAGWVLQMLHFSFFGEHYDNPLVGVGVIVQMVFALVALGISLIAYFLADKWRQRMHL